MNEKLQRAKDLFFVMLEKKKVVVVMGYSEFPRRAKADYWDDDGCPEPPDRKVRVVFKAIIDTVGEEFAMVTDENSNKHCVQNSRVFVNPDDAVYDLKVDLDLPR